MALLSAALDRNFYASRFFQIVIRILVLLPAIVLFCFIVYKLLKKPLKGAYILIKQRLPQARLQLCCSSHKDNRVTDEEHGGNTDIGGDEIQLPDRIVHPELYTQEGDQTV